MNLSKNHIKGICKGCGEPVIPSWHWCEKCDKIKQKILKKQKKQEIGKS